MPLDITIESRNYTTPHPPPPLAHKPPSPYTLFLPMHVSSFILYISPPSLWSQNIDIRVHRNKNSSYSFTKLKVITSHKINPLID